MDDDYFVKTTLYVLGSVWAYERIFLYDGIYHELDSFQKEAGSNLMNLLKQFPWENGLFRYHRIALSEILIVDNKERGHTVLPFIEFQYLIDDQKYQNALIPAIEWVRNLQNFDPNEVFPKLEREVNYLLNNLGGTDHYSRLAREVYDHR